MSPPPADVSRVSRATKGGNSVRTTIPSDIAEALGAKPGTLLVWHVTDGTATVRRLDLLSVLA